VAQHEIAADRVTTLSLKMVIYAHGRSRSRGVRQSGRSGKAQRPTAVSPILTVVISLAPIGDTIPEG